MPNKNTTVWIVGFVCSVPIFFILMVCLWEYKELVGAALLLLIFLVVGVYVRGQITEQNLRVYRFNHHEETPLTMANQPVILRPDMRETAQQFNCYQLPSQQQSYPQE